MSSKALQIVEVIQTLFETPALTGIGAGGVVDDPDYAFNVSDLPMVAVYMGDETPPDRSVISMHDNTAIITVRVTAKKGGVTGKSALASCDPLVVATYNRLMAAPTLGGLAFDIQKQATRRSRDVIEVPVAYTEIDYAVQFRTTDTSLET
ncbi:MAG TPA: hypothetical protein DCK83_00425 [Gallionellaceae bacterium]|nr:hypothetical protein [Gallionellaceae bacterium]